MQAVDVDFPAPASIDVGSLVYQVNRHLLDVHTVRLAELGADESGLYDHYVNLVNGGAVLCAPEIQAFTLVSEALPAFNEYVVLRAGLGELALLLNQAGLPAVACEMNAKRFEALAAGCERIDRRGEEKPRFQLVEGYLPHTIGLRPALGIATDFVYNLDLESDREFRRRLRQLDAVLLNPRLFIRVRESATQQRAALDFLRDLGFTEITEYPGAALLLAARPPGRSADSVPASGEMASDDFDSLVQAAISLVPKEVPQDSPTTWVKRRVREFDMKSAFGNGE
jgi:hypothetical protein